MLRSYEKYGIKPLLKDSDNAFMVMLPNVNYQIQNELGKGLSQQEQIMEYLKRNGEITRNMVEKLLGLSKTRANEILYDMVINSLITKKGKGKNVTYIIK